MGKIVLRLDRMMVERRMSLNELADRVGISNVNLSNIKTGKISAIRFIFNQQELECFEKIKALRPESIYRASEIMPIDGRLISDSSTRYGFYILQSESMEDMLGLLRMSGLDETYFD